MEKLLESVFYPLILIVVGAFISNRLIPKITQKWQNYQKALELKTGIITELIQCLMEILGNGDLLHEEADPKNKDEILKNSKEKKLDWVIRRCVIGSKLHAYFPEEKYHDKELHDYFSKDLSGEFINYCFDIKLKDWKNKRVTLLDDKADFIKIILETNITVLEHSKRRVRPTHQTIGSIKVNA